MQAHRTLDLEAVHPTLLAVVRRTIAERRALLTRPSSPAWYWVGALGLAAIGALAARDFGVIGDATEGVSAIAGYALGCGGLAVAWMLYHAHRRFVARLGFTPGVYAIGGHLLDARRPRLAIHALSAAAPHSVHRHVNGIYTGTTLHWYGHTFAFGSKRAWEAALDGVRDELFALATAASSGDTATLYIRDPLAFAAPVAPPPRVVPVSWRRIALTAGICAASATQIWAVRNASSRSAALACVATEEQALTWVARDGGNVELGRARAAELGLGGAIAADRADQLRQGLADYPDADPALRDRATAALAQRLRTAHATAATRAAGSPELAWFVDQVYAGMSADRPAALQLHIAHTDHDALTALDATDRGLRTLGRDRHPLVLVGRFFAAVGDLDREARLHAEVAAAVAPYFPVDIVRISDDHSSDVPTITLAYTLCPQLDADGAPLIYMYTDEHHQPLRESRAYPGVELDLRATFEAGGALPHTVAFAARPAPDLVVVGHGATTDADDAQTYGVMAESAYADLHTQLLAALDGTPKT